MSVSSAAQILMCPPLFFTVTYKINPWMRPETWQQDGENYVRARTEWTGLYSTLQQAGAEMFLLAPEVHVPDLVFTANAAFVLDGTAIVSNFRHPERQPEAKINREWFERFGLKTVDIDHTHEGGGDALFDPTRKCVWMGHGFRTDPEAVKAYEKVLGCEVISLPLASERFYHLDTCFCPLSTGHILYYPKAFTPEALKTLESRADGWLLPVSDEEADTFACNSVCIGNDICMPDAGQGGGLSPVQQRLTDLGYTVHQVNLAAFLLGGGAAKCLTLRLDDKL